MIRPKARVCGRPENMGLEPSTRQLWGSDIFYRSGSSALPNLVRPLFTGSRRALEDWNARFIREGWHFFEGRYKGLSIIHAGLLGVKYHIGELER